MGDRLVPEFADVKGIVEYFSAVLRRSSECFILRTRIDINLRQNHSSVVCRYGQAVAERRRAYGRCLQHPTNFNRIAYKRAELILAVLKDARRQSFSCQCIFLMLARMSLLFSASFAQKS